MLEKTYTLIALKPEWIFQEEIINTELVYETGLNKERLKQRIIELKSYIPKYFCESEYIEILCFEDCSEELNFILNESLSEGRRIKKIKEFEIQRKYEEEQNLKNTQKILEEKELLCKLLQKYPELKK